MNTAIDIPTYFQTIVINELVRCIAIAENHFNRQFLMPTIDYTLTGCSAGVAYMGRNHIRLNYALLSMNPGEIASTTAHEFAHLVDKIAYHDYHAALLDKKIFSGKRIKRSVHGPTWKLIMGLFGVNNERCHMMDTSAVKRKKRTQRWAYTCSCNSQMYLSTTVYNRITRGTHTYRCRKCKHAIDFRSLSNIKVQGRIPITISNP